VDKCGSTQKSANPLPPVFGRLVRCSTGAPPMGAPPMGVPPMGAPPMGAPPMGAPPMGAPPMGAPPMGALLRDYSMTVSCLIHFYHSKIKFTS